MSVDELHNWVDKFDEKLKVARAGRGLLSDWAYRKGGGS